MYDKNKASRYLQYWQEDWNRFARDVLKARLDREQQDVLSSVQFNKMTAVSSGTARGKDYVSACACLCFMYLTPYFDKNGKLIGNTKVAMTAPTARQVYNIMTPEIRRLFKSALILPGRLVSNDIRTNYEEWFLTGFKASDDNTEVWSGFHAVNTMFAVTEASGISETVFNAIEGNLQGNSRLLIVFNFNTTSGYAARAMSSSRFNKFRLDSLNAENVVKKKIIIPGQVDYDWVKDKVETWCTAIRESDFNEGEGDFEWEGGLYRPNDLFRVKVRGMSPKVSEDVLIPYEWFAIANERYKKMQLDGVEDILKEPVRLGVDVAGMGRDSSVFCYRYGNYVDKFDAHQSGGNADHMKVAGKTKSSIELNKKSKAFIDTIGEGAGVYSRLIELKVRGAISVKFSESAKGLRDITGQYTFVNMRAFLMWCVRDWLNPKNGYNAAMPFCEKLVEEATQTRWSFESSGSIKIEPKEKIKEKIKRSPDYLDSLANTFYPHDKNNAVSDEEILEDFL